MHGAGRTILLVDDDLTVRDPARRILERSDFGVLLADDGVSAFEVLASSSVPIVLMVSDVAMPCMDGAKLRAHLRRTGNAVPVLLEGGYAEEEVLALVADDPRTRFIEMPFTIDQLATMSLGAWRGSSGSRRG